MRKETIAIVGQTDSYLSKMVNITEKIRYLLQSSQCMLNYVWNTMLNWGTCTKNKSQGNWLPLINGIPNSCWPSFSIRNLTNAEYPSRCFFISSFSILWIWSSYLLYETFLRRTLWKPPSVVCLTAFLLYKTCCIFIQFVTMWTWFSYVLQTRYTLLIYILKGI